MVPKLRDTRRVFTGKRVSLEVQTIEDEETGKVFEREVVKHPGAVVILPLLDARTVLLIRNRRHAIGTDLIELPAGTLEKGEMPIDCAGRELSEETGYIAGRLRPIGAFFASPGVLTEKLFAFVATDLEPGRVSLDETEQITVLPTPMDQAIAMIGTGEIQDAKTIATLLMFARFGVK